MSLIGNWKVWFQRRRKGQKCDDINERNIAVSDAIGALATAYKNVDTEPLKRSVASLSFLAVLTGTGDNERLFYAAATLNRLATNALDEFSDPKPSDPQNELNRLIEKGVDILNRSIAERKWELAAEHLPKLIFLDELLARMKRGEVIPLDTWPDVIGEQ